MSEDSPFASAPRFLWAHTSPLLADPEWIAGFRWMIEQLLSTARGMKRHENLPSYRNALVVREWHPFLERLSLHVMKVVDAGRNGPAIAAYVLDARVEKAFQLTCAMLDDMLVRKAVNKNKTPIPLSTLEAISELLAHLTAPTPAEPSTPPTGEKRPSEAPAELPDLVTLDQAAALVNRQPNGLRHYRKKGMPKPQIQGRKGKPNEYLWSEMRPWLEETFGRKIPELAIMKFRTSREKMLDHP